MLLTESPLEHILIVEMEVEMLEEVDNLQMEQYDILLGVED